MSHTYFIADLHLDKKRPEISNILASFLHNEASQADALYILGDLFEYWVGDDQPTDEFSTCIEGLIHLSNLNIPVYFIHGNRDFLIGEAFADKTGITLLTENEIIDLYGNQTLVMHGDTLCTDDKDYQELRSLLRDSTWQSEFLALPLKERISRAQALREQSKEAMAEKDDIITDVNLEEVLRIMRLYHVQLLIHGHTHRPAMHKFKIDKQPASRIVLADWYRAGSALKVECTESTKLKTSTITLS